MSSVFDTIRVINRIYKYCNNYRIFDPPINKNSNSKSIGIQLEFPDEITSTENKVIYSLWREGDQSFYNLQLLVGISQDHLDTTLNTLLRKKRVLKIPNSAATLGAKNLGCLYHLNAGI